jgi:hypothetical protein
MKADRFKYSKYSGTEGQRHRGTKKKMIIKISLSTNQLKLKDLIKSKKKIDCQFYENLCPF